MSISSAVTYLTQRFAPAFKPWRPAALALGFGTALFALALDAAALDLHAAARAGDAEAARAALEGGVAVDAADNWGRTPLIVALQQGKLEMAQWLLAHGASVGASDAWGRTPLLVAAQLKNVAAVRLLLGHRPDVNAANKNDITPLIAAAQTGEGDIAALLLAAGAALEREDNLGRTALMWAAWRKDAVVVNMLLAHGADAAKTGRDGRSAQDLARSRGADAALVALLEPATPAAAAPASRARPAGATTAKRTLSPAIDAKRIVRGEPKAAVTLVEYTDFQCPYCAYGAKTVEEVMARYEGQIRLVVKHLPLPLLHPMAMACALHFEAIAMQSGERAWAFYDRVFADQAALAGGEPKLRSIAAGLGVDLARLDADLRRRLPQQRVTADLKESERFRFDGVPVFIVNGQVVEGAQPPQVFFDLIDALLRQ